MRAVRVMQRWEAWAAWQSHGMATKRKSKGGKQGGKHGGKHGGKQGGKKTKVIAKKAKGSKKRKGTAKCRR